MDNTLLKVREGEETSRQAGQVDKTTTGEVEHTLDSLRVDLAADRDTTEAGCKLSQGDLVLCLSKLNDQIHSLKGQVYDAIGQSYEEFTQTFDNAVHVEKAIAELTDGLAAVTQQIEDPHTGIHAALVKPALELEHITQQAALTGELIQTVTVLNQLNDKLCAFTQAMDAFTLPAAARLTREIGELLRQLPTEDQDTRNVPAVFIAVKKRHRRRCERLRARLGALLRQALTFEATSLSYSPLLTVHLSSQEEGKQVVTVPLADIFEAMDSVDEEGAPDQRFLEREMEEFVCHALRTGVLHFILAHAFSGQAWEVRIDEAEHKRIYLAEKQHSDEATSERAHDAKSERAVSVDNLFGVLGAFFGLLSSHVFARDRQRLALLGHLLWEPLCRDIIAKVLSPAIPSDTAKLAQYQRETIQSTEKFEEEMVALGLVPASAASGPDDTHSDTDHHHQPPPAEARRLSRFINNVDNHFAAKKQKKILNRARNLLLNQEANVCLKEVCTANMLPDVSSFLTINATSEADANANADKRRRRRQSAVRANAGAGSGGGVDDVDVDENEEEGLRRIATQSKKGECHDVAAGATPQTDDRVFIFQMPTCQVSASTIGLVVLAHHTLEEACRLRDSAPQCAHTLQQTARDLFDLYRAIMPLQYQKETIKSVPSLAMAFHNDCFYLALQLLTLGMRYQDRLPKDKGAFTLVDLVPVFRQLGEKQYQQQVEKQQAVLKETVQSAQGLADTHLRVRFMTVERAMKRVVHHLTHLSRVWKDVLPRHVYLRTVGQLLDVALEDLIASFEKLEDISEEETHHLHELLSLLLDCSSFFTATADEGGGSEGEGEGGQAVLAESGREEETKRHARRWSKFVKIVNMLESKLVVIVDAYVKGLMPEFEAEELKAIIRALFSDSPLRKSQLALIK